MEFGDLANKAKEFAGEHGDKVEQGLDKAGEFAKEKFGHEEQIDKGLDKAKDFLGGQGEQGGQGGEQR
ncbi:antitoxin [Sciscionella sediminilitoris]|uniref:antitoxin n=1 Tax=Sciscionella sediminilitoris TaxID=1445613 RepID=UPI0004DF4267|nr:antitoxin [Sciscionella sp. SE31]